MFKVECTFSGDDKTVSVIGGRSSLWKAQDYTATLPETDSKSMKSDYSWAYYLAEQSGKLEELGCAGMPFEDAINYLADSYDVEIKPVEDEAPLVSTPAK
ncbi:MAG: hypothetical protein KHZ79_06240 [Atopobium minutum]|uniref:Phage protein n=1 Tax=Atopobium minutum TaxID=1381 RepID=A0AB38A4T9_9ACTN|nr:hypothetical protein [Atopobium minutum]KRN55041.1 hypothetical protein IV72_GL000537 [Atopobium minutum]MBS4873954.1 hypothetical protein [Atopobium minutum]SEB43545.1 hypothetical protein SAMN04489746_0212 [Atopobium minutum]